MSTNQPVAISYAALASVLRGMAEMVESGDSLEGSIAYHVPMPPDDPEDAEVMVMASFRIGNTMGQGGVRIIGTLGGIPQ